MTLVGQPGEGCPAGQLDVIGMGANRQYPLERRGPYGVALQEAGSHGGCDERNACQDRGGIRQLAVSCHQVGDGRHGERAAGDPETDGQIPRRPDGTLREPVHLWK